MFPESDMVSSFISDRRSAKVLKQLHRCLFLKIALFFDVQQKCSMHSSHLTTQNIKRHILKFLHLIQLIIFTSSSGHSYVNLATYHPSPLKNMTTNKACAFICTKVPAILHHLANVYPVKRANKVVVFSLK